MALTDKFEDLGPNSGLVEEMYRQYLARTRARSRASWQEFFADYVPARRRGAATNGDGAAPPRRRTAAGAAVGHRSARSRRPSRRRTGGAAPLVLDGETAAADPRRGGAHRREHGGEPRRPDRDVGAQRPGEAARGQPPDPEQPPQPHRSRQGELHPPHRVRRGRQGRPPGAGDGLRASASIDGKPVVVRHEHLNLGLAVDVAKSGRLAHAARPEHQARRRARLRRRSSPTYEELIRKVRTEQAHARRLRRHHRHDHQPRARSAPSTRCRGSCPARASSSASARSAYPAEYEGADPQTVARLGDQQGHHAHEHLRPPRHPGRGERRVPPLRSTTCLLGARRASTTRSSRASACPYEPARWTTDISPLDDENAHIREGRPRPPAHQHVPGARPPHREPRPARSARARTPTPSSTSTTTA